MNPNLGSQEERYRIVKEIKGAENQLRKTKAYKAYEIFKDQIHDHVCRYLEAQFGKASAASMPKISSVNLAKKVVTEESSVYQNPPTRTISEADESEKKVLEQVFSDGRFNAKLKKANEYFKLYKGQIFLQVILQDKKLVPRVVLPHQLDVIPDAENPEKAFAYITSSFDRNLQPVGDGVNQTIADPNDDYALRERYTVWSEQYNFIMNGKGEIVSGPDVENEIKALPFVDISVDKDGDFFVIAGDSDTEFTIQYNGSLSDLMHICRLQGYAQMVFIGDPASMPEVVRTGPNVVIKVATKEGDTNKPDFKFESPTPNIEGSIRALEMILANYLTTRGIDSKVIASTLDSSNTYNSGIERLLAMLEEFEASADDFEIFSAAEQEIFALIKLWLAKYSQTEYLDKKYWIQPKTQSAVLTVNFARPEAVKTETEQLTDMEVGKRLGIEDEVTICMAMKNMNEEQAIEYLTKLKGRKGMFSTPLEVPAPGDQANQDPAGKAAA